MTDQKSKRDEFENFFAILKTIDYHQYWIVEDPEILWEFVESYGQEMYEKGREDVFKKLRKIIASHTDPDFKTTDYERIAEDVIKSIEWDKLEVVGNIYQTPELLEESNDK